jgi:hypothetical protein
VTDPLDTPQHKVLAVIERRVIALLSLATIGPSNGCLSVITAVRMSNHPHRLPLGKVRERYSLNTIGVSGTGRTSPHTSGIMNNPALTQIKSMMFKSQPWTDQMVAGR